MRYVYLLLPLGETFDGVGVSCKKVKKELKQNVVLVHGISGLEVRVTLVSKGYLVRVLTITTISGWNLWVEWLRIIHTGRGGFTLYLTLDNEFQYFFIHTFSFYLVKPYS